LIILHNTHVIVGYKSSLPVELGKPPTAVITLGDGQNVSLGKTELGIVGGLVVVQRTRLTHVGSKVFAFDLGAGLVLVRIVVRAVGSGGVGTATELGQLCVELLARVLHGGDLALLFFELAFGLVLSHRVGGVELDQLLEALLGLGFGLDSLAQFGQLRLQLGNLLLGSKRLVLLCKAVFLASPTQSIGQSIDRRWCSRCLAYLGRFTDSTTTTSTANDCRATRSSSGTRGADTGTGLRSLEAGVLSDVWFVLNVRWHSLTGLVLLKVQLDIVGNIDGANNGVNGLATLVQKSGEFVL
jgi:hypothetical protein